MRRIAFTFSIVVIGLGVLAIGGIGTLLALENQDVFCASCHTEPEATYFQRETQTAATDLASFHSQKNTRCIDCHSGGGILGRTDGLKQGARDLVNYISGKYHSPAITLHPLGDVACVKCHANVFVRPAGASRAGLGHYHYFLPQWQQLDGKAAQCVSCHIPHTQVSANLTFMVPGQVSIYCDECHSSLSGVVK